MASSGNAYAPPPGVSGLGVNLITEWDRPDSLRSACFLPTAFNQEKLSSFNTSRKKVMLLQPDHGGVR